MRTVSTMIVAGVLLAFSASAPALAQSDEVGPPGYPADPGYDSDDRGRVPDGLGIDAVEAVRAARSVGLVDPESVYRQGRNWVVEGTDSEGLDITVIIDGRSGDVVDID